MCICGRREERIGKADEGDSGGMGEHEGRREGDMGTGGGMQRWKSAEGAAEDVAEKDKLPLKNYALCDSFDTLLHSIIL